MVVIAAEGDSTARQLITQSLSETEFRTHVFERVDDAFECSRGTRGPAIVLVPCAPRDRFGAELLGQLRSSAERYAIATLGPGQGAAVVDVVEAGADDVLVKPFSGELLLSRLRVAARRCLSGARVVGTPRHALREALSSRSGGEVVIRRRELVARVYVVGGAIGWVVVSGEPPPLPRILEQAGIAHDEEFLAALVDETRRSGLHFSEVLVGWGCLDAPAAREAVRSYVADRLSSLLAWEDAAAMFLPRDRALPSSLLFDPRELVGNAVSIRPPSLAPRRSLPPVSTVEYSGEELAALASLLERAGLVDGARSVVVLEGQGGATRFAAGDPIDGGVVWALLSTLDALRPGSHETLAVRGSEAFLAHRLSSGDAIVVKLDLGLTSLGFGRASLQRLVRAHEARLATG